MHLYEINMLVLFILPLPHPAGSGNILQILQYHNQDTEVDTVKTENISISTRTPGAPLQLHPLSLQLHPSLIPSNH